MAWIESHQSLSRHRKTLRLAELLKCDRHKVIGHLHELWWWAVDNVSVTGDLGDATRQEIGIAAGWPAKGAEAFADALLSAGFLDRGGDGQFVLHDWFDYAGKLIEQRERQRAGNAERQRAARERHALRNGKITHASRVMESNSHGATRPNQTQPDPTRPKTGSESESAFAPRAAAPAASPEKLPFDEITEPEPDYPPWLHQLRDIPSWPKDLEKDSALAAWAEREQLPVSALEVTALDLASKAIWVPPKRQWSASGRWYADIRLVFKAWTKRERLRNGASGQSPGAILGAGANGRPRSAGAIDTSIRAGSKYRSTYPKPAVP